MNCVFENGNKASLRHVVIHAIVEKLPPAGKFAFDHGETIELYLNYKKNPHPLPLLS